MGCRTILGSTRTAVIPVLLPDALAVSPGPVST